MWTKIGGRGNQMKPWFSVIALTMSFITACGESDSDSARTEDPPKQAEVPVSNNGATMPPDWVSDPCSLIGNEEMSGLLPNPVAGSVLSAGLCDYGPTDLTIGRVDVQVYVQDVAATGCDLVFSVGGFNSAEPVDGIGTAARWKGESGPDQLGVCVDNNKALAITIYDPDKSTEALATARAIGELVIARLK